MLRLIITILPLLLAGCNNNTDGSTVASQDSWDGSVQVYGALRAMFHQGQTGPTVSLDTILPDPELYAVGALADLAGEVTVVAGKTWLSYPDGESARIEIPARPEAEATLLAASRVASWHTCRTRKTIHFEQLDDKIARLALESGMSLDERFPFLLEGVFEDLHWHVIDGTRLTAGGGSHQDHLAAAVKGRIDRVPATLVGFYSAKDQGVFTHMGSRTHIHCVPEEPFVCGHVDRVVVPAGTTVKFPKREERTDKAIQRIGTTGR